MTASKRKNDSTDIAGSQGAKMVIVGNHSNNSTNGGNDESEWIASAMDRMKQLRASWETQPGNNMSFMTSPNRSAFMQDTDEDEIAKAMQSVRQGDAEPEDHLAAKAHGIKSKISKDIELAKASLSQESGVLVQLASQLAKFQEQRKALLENIDQLDQQQRASQQQIAMYQEEASQELDLVSDLEQEKKSQVPRLKASISLYATLSGIKWDFSDPEVLSGQVSIPSQQSFKLFSIDPRDQGPVKTADMLWEMMEGETVMYH